MTSAEPLIYLDQANFPSLSTADFLATAAAAGAQAIDLHPLSTGEPLAEVVRQVQRSGLLTCLVSPVPSWFEPFQQGDGFPSEVLRLVEVAGALGSRIGVPSPVHDEPAAHRPDLGPALTALVEQAGRHGARVGFEPVGESVRFPGKHGVVSSLAAARALRDRLELPIELIADSYCLATAGLDLTADWLADDVAVLQLADRLADRPGRVLPGAGALPLDGWLAATKLRPGVAIGIETFPLSRPDDPAGLASQLISAANRAAGLSRIGDR